MDNILKTYSTFLASETLLLFSRNSFQQLCVCVCMVCKQVNQPRLSSLACVYQAAVRESGQSMKKIFPKFCNRYELFNHRKTGFSQKQFPKTF